jgi:hypothetical protein
MLWAAWTDRNSFIFQSVRSVTPLQAIIRRTLLKVEALCRKTCLVAKVNTLLTNRLHLDELREKLNSSAVPQPQDFAPNNDGTSLPAPLLPAPILGDHASGANGVNSDSD